MGAETRATAILICGAQVGEAKNKTSLRSSSLLLRVLLAVGSCGLSMNLLIFAVLTPYFFLHIFFALWLIHNSAAGLPLAMMCLLSL